jgi:membrane protease YdiL (CAAX protease family)
MNLRFCPALMPLLYLLACAVVFALIAYPLFLLFQGTVGFRTLMFRGTLVLIFLGFVLLSKRLAVGWDAMGLARGWKAILRQFCLGFGAGMLILAVHAAMLVAMDVRVINAIHVQDWGSYPRWIGKSLLSGLGVGINEELLFRGFLLGYLLQRVNRAVAILACAFYFAGLHFVNTSMDPPVSELNGGSGLAMVMDAFGSTTGRFRLDTFLALFSAGAFLAVIRVYVPFGLVYCMGLHAGWVWVIKMTRYLTELSKTSEWSFLISRFDGVIGYLSAGWITLLTLALVCWFESREARQALRTAD